MYLYKKTYVQNWDDMTPSEKHQITVKKNNKPVKHIKPARITYITEQVGYWRKVNAIHDWFVKNVQNGVDECQEAHVELEKLIELKMLCEQVLADHSLAKTLLPCADGFFFGYDHTNEDANYTEWYFQGLQDTVKIIEELENEIEPGNDYIEGDLYYHSSW